MSGLKFIHPRLRLVLTLKIRCFIDDDESTSFSNTEVFDFLDG